MILPGDTLLLEELGKNNHGRALRAYLEDELRKIDTVKGVTTLDEALAREKAVLIIEKLFAFMDVSRTPEKKKVVYT